MCVCMCVRACVCVKYVRKHRSHIRSTWSWWAVATSNPSRALRKIRSTWPINEKIFSTKPRGRWSRMLVQDTNLCRHRLWLNWQINESPKEGVSKTQIHSGPKKEKLGWRRRPNFIFIEKLLAIVYVYPFLQIWRCFSMETTFSSA